MKTKQNLCKEKHNILLIDWLVDENSCSSEATPLVGCELSCDSDEVICKLVADTDVGLGGLVSSSPVGEPYCVP